LLRNLEIYVEYKISPNFARVFTKNKNKNTISQEKGV